MILGGELYFDFTGKEMWNDTAGSEDKGKFNAKINELANLIKKRIEELEECLVFGEYA